MAQPVLTPSGVYQLRRKVPPELLAVLGREYKRSLKTRDPAEAKVRFAEEWVRSERVFALARAQKGGAELLAPRDIEQLASRWYRSELAKAEASDDGLTAQLAEGRTRFSETAHGLERHVPLVSLTEAMQDDPEIDIAAFVEAAMKTTLKENGIPVPLPSTAIYGSLVTAFRSHLLKLSEVAFRRYMGDWVTTAPVLADEPLSFEGKRSPVVPEGKQLLVVFEEYAREKQLNDGSVRGQPKTIGGFGATVRQFVEVFGNLPVGKITREVMRNFREQVARLPVKGEGIRKLTFQELIAKADAEDLPRVQEATIRNKLRAISAVMSYAVRMGYCDENPLIAGGIAKAAAKAASNRGAANRRRKDYTLDELKQIFSSPIYKKEGWTPPRADFGAAWYWMPLLMYYTGARREELAQMETREVVRSPEGVWYLNILFSDDGDDAGRSVKTNGSRRLVPIHPDLVALGFTKYATEQKSLRLFPQLKPDPNGYYGTNFGKRWASYLRETVGLVSPAKPAHGFRHTFKTLSRQEGIAEDVHDAITGHAGASAVARDYGEMPLSRMALEIAKYPTAPGLVPILQSR